MGTGIQDRVTSNLLAFHNLHQGNLIPTNPERSIMPHKRFCVKGVPARERVPPISGVGKRLDSSKTCVTVLANPLVREGMAEWKPDPDDRRVNRLSIARKRRRYLDVTLAVFLKKIRDSPLTPDGKDVANVCISFLDLHEIQPGLA